MNDLFKVVDVECSWSSVIRSEFDSSLGRDGRVFRGWPKKAVQDIAVSVEEGENQGNRE